LRAPLKQVRAKLPLRHFPLSGSVNFDSERFTAFAAQQRSGDGWLFNAYGPRKLALRPEIRDGSA